MLDVDGTTIPYNYDAPPSDAVAEAIKKASQTIKVSLVTGRSYRSIKQVLEKLDVHEGYAVINNGAQVLDITTGKLFYDQPITQNNLSRIFAVLTKEGIKFYVKDTEYDSSPERTYHTNKQYEKVWMIYTDDTLTPEQSERVIKLLHPLHDLTILNTHHKNPHTYALNITHANATKLHGIQTVQKLLGITKDETIGVGDSYNDFPLLMACGLKVAMGNAVPELKAIADYVAPNVTEDGVAEVIEKYILNT